MTARTDRCLEPEVIAAFVAGTLSGAELRMVADHLRTCEDCREVAAEAARIDREETDNAIEEPRRRAWPWWVGVAAAAALAGIAFVTLWRSRGDESGGAIAPLVAVMPRYVRYVEPRLTPQFPWAPLRGMRRGANEPLDAAHMKVVGAAGEVLQRTDGKGDVESIHAAALAHLFAGRPRDGAAQLARIAPSASSAQIWSDLAACRYAAAIADDDPPQLAEALAAADAALRIAPNHPEALFNRALIIERLGLRDRAREAWERYLAADGGSEWATEARQHLQDLAPVTEFREEFHRQYATLCRDALAAEALVRRYPQDARVWGETDVLGRWADALEHGDSAGAAVHLRVARAFGDQLARQGEKLLLHAVIAIEHAGPFEKRALAEAHLRYRSAQLAYGANQPAAAQEMFVAAAEGFERGHSPIALYARYFAANTLYDEGHIEEARSQLEALAASAPPGFHAHRAQIQWQLGLAYASLARWGESIQALTESVTTFERLGEMRYSYAVRDILAEVYDRIGDRRAAWGHRVVTLRELGRTGGPRMAVALHAAARAAAVNRDWPVSVSMLGLLAETVRQKDDTLYIDALLMRARLDARIGDDHAAATDLAEATNAISRLADASLRERAGANRLAVQAILTSSPADALPLLSRALEYHRTKGRRMHVPDLLLQRGRAHSALGDPNAAAADFGAGIHEVEAQRTSLGSRDAAWGTVAVAEELFDEAIGLAADRGDADGAFAYAERARIPDTEPTAVTVAIPAHAAGAVVVEYAALPARLIIFVVSRGRVRAVQNPVSRDVLSAEAAGFARSAMANDELSFRRSAAAMYQRLLAPIETDIGGAKTVVFVPDATLGGVPFSALLGPNGSYLVEEHAVVIAPSSRTFFACAAQRQNAPREAKRLLLMAGAAMRKGDLGRLSAAAREAEAITGEYGPATDVVAERIEPVSFERHAANADVIHFVGHADMPDGVAEAALVTAFESDAGGRLEAREIAAMKLRRTRVVVLAACGTAQERQRTGERSISVARAFLSAGVSSVVATLWPIEDEPAAAFFSALHRQLAGGRSPADALRDIQVDWIRAGEPPSMWAAVQVIGS